MNLRRQLMLVAILLLCLPWAGGQFIREMEGAMRHGQEQSLQATAKAVAAVLNQRVALLYPNPERLNSRDEEGLSLYAQPTASAINVDGYGDGWEDIEATRFEAANNGEALALLARAVTHQNSLYLLLDVQDKDIVYHNPGLSREPNGDRLVLSMWQRNQRQNYIISTSAPGKVRAIATGKPGFGADPGRIRGYWQDAEHGYTLELEIPLTYSGGRLGFYIVNANDHDGEPISSAGNISPGQSAKPPWLIYSPNALQQVIAPFGNSGKQVQVVDQHGWRIGELGRKTTGQANSETFWLLQLVYRSILSDDSLAAAPASLRGKLQGNEVTDALQGHDTSVRYRDTHYATRTELAASSPIYWGEDVSGAVIVRQSGEEYLSLTDQAFSRLLGYSMLAIALAALGLLGYASLLSWRIRKLSIAAAQVVAEDGSIGEDFPRSRANDEIGELSRHYADLLDQVRDYNEYLRTLSSKLSHELRTPIAVIQTSLEHLEHPNATQHDTETYLARAREGLNRLNHMLTAMSEANRLEESISNNQRSLIDLVPLVRELHGAYIDLYPEHNITLSIEEAEANTDACAELLVQALDKLMDNAASFCPPDGLIEITLNQGKNSWRLSVSNQGVALAKNLRERLFEPMVSMRTGDTGSVHLGLGLHIVKLITEFHNGTIAATNLPENKGARFTLTLPIASSLHKSHLFELS